MARAAGLAKALGRRGPRPGAEDDLPERPSGQLVWIHLPDPLLLSAAELLACRLRQLAEDMAGEVSVLITVAPPPGSGPHVVLPGLPASRPGIAYAHPPSDDTAEIAAFLDQVRPDAMIWIEGHLRSAVLTQLRRLAIPSLLAGVREEGLAEPRWRLGVNQSRRMLTGFTRIHATDAGTARRLQRLGAEAARLHITGPLQEGAAALPCDDAERDDLAHELTARPIWLAAMAHPEELDVILEAHAQACRVAHRLVLILVPDDPEDADAFAAALDAQNWRYLRWSTGDYPREETQVLLADTRGDMGLWYRLAPVTFMAGSLARGMKGHDPYEPAALGSAVIYGPYVSRHLRAYSRLSQLGAARIVRDAGGLRAALVQLLAPDQAATMASAAWQVLTEGAEGTDSAVEWVLERLEERAMA